MKQSVTAQDILNAMKTDEGDGVDILNWEKTMVEWAALLSRARQEARREALKEMDELFFTYRYCHGPKRQEYLGKLNALRAEYNQP